jgi:hypothetical protein
VSIVRRVILAVSLLLSATALDAHPLNVGYAEITVHAREVVVALSLNLFELDLLLALDRNRDARVDQEELDARRTAILDYLRRKISVSAAGDELPLAAGPLAIRRGPDGQALFETTLRFRSAALLTSFTIRSEPLTELGEDHTMLAKITDEGRVEQFVFQHGAVYDRRARGFWAHALQFLGLGVHHIFLGGDHVAFLVGLLLMGGPLLNIVKIVTAFTLAHSVTLSLAALDLVTLPARLVEAGIALSIAYVALENLFFTTFDKRWLVSLVFGFMHGFGFATVLKEMHLATSGLAASLFFFNVGVEVGQILIVALVVPLLWALGRTPVYRPTVRLASVAILSAGAFWFFQRAF